MADSDLTRRAREVLAGHYPRCATVTGRVNDRWCRECRDAMRRAEEIAEGLGEPFCACGRRWSECDGSRSGCQSRGMKVARLIAEGSR